MKENNSARSHAYDYKNNAKTAKIKKEVIEKIPERD
jgi:hypothetical protein